MPPPSPTCPSLRSRHAAILEEKDAFSRALTYSLDTSFPLEERKRHLRDAFARKKTMEAIAAELEESLGSVSPETAASLIGGERVLAGEDYHASFGFSPEIPKRIRFTKEFIETFKQTCETLNLDFRLVYKAAATPEGLPFTMEEQARRAGNNVIGTEADGTKSYRLYRDQFGESGNIKPDAWFANDDTVKKAVPSGKWGLVSDDVLPGSTNKPYIPQTDALIAVWQKSLLPGMTPKERRHCETIFAQWNNDKPQLQKLVDTAAATGATADHIAAANALAAHPATALLREPFPATAERGILLQKTRNKKILPSAYSWSSTPSSDGLLVSFGGFGSAGASVGGDWPGIEWTGHGAVLSRSEF